MRKVSKEEFIRMPAGTLYSISREASNYNPGLMIKMDTGEPYKGWGGDVCWHFLGTMPLAPDIPYDEEAGYITKWLTDYKVGEDIKSEWGVVDDSPCDFDDSNTIIVYTKEDIKFMIKLLQTLCIDQNFNDEEINSKLG